MIKTHPKKMDLNWGLGLRFKDEHNTTEEEKAQLYDHLHSLCSPKPDESTIFLPSTTDALEDRLYYLCGEFGAGNTTALKPEIISILQKLKEKGVLPAQECDKLCAQFQNEEIVSESESEGTSDEEINDVDFYQLIRTTTENITRNLRKNLYKLMSGINDDTLRSKIDGFLAGEEIAESVITSLNNDVDSIKIKILINEIELVHQKVKYP